MTLDSFKVNPALRHVSRRPRLTRLLDESPARLILLVAPAGYGKTTLAREWLDQGGRESAWYRGTPASADIAVLAAGLAQAAAMIVPGAGQRMSDRLRITPYPDRDVKVLAELLAEDLCAWPPSAWLVVDDYHFAMGSETGDTFIDHLCARAQISLLVTSRLRPRWSTPRRALYGELIELRRDAL